MVFRSNTLFGGIIRYFVRHGTLANILLALMLVSGIVCVSKIRAQFFPDVIIETITVSAVWKGAGPEDIDENLVSLIEPNLVGVDSIDSIQSISREGGMRISINFESGTDMSKAMTDVKDVVDDVQNIPENVSEIKVVRRQWRDRVTNVILSGPVSLEQLSRFADEFTQKLNTLGVNKTLVSGVEAPIIRVSVPESVIIKHDLSLAEISGAIQSGAEATPSGELDQSAARIKTGSEKRKAEEIGNILIRSSPNGSKLLVSDIALINVEGLSREKAFFRDDNPAIFIRVNRGPQGDAINLQKTVEEVSEQLRETLPKGVSIELAGTRAQAIQDRLNILLKNGAQGLSLVLILLFLFLSARTAFWVALGIPAAMLFAIAMMYMVGLTLNMISLFALILCLGIVVDDAIVVGEHADFRARRLGESPTQAAERSALRMGLPVFTATITTILAFTALVSIGGRFGRLISDIPFTVVVVLLASLVECFLILPNHMKHALNFKLKRTAWYDTPSVKFNDLFRLFRQKVFVPITRIVINFRYLLIVFGISILIISSSLLFSGDVKWRFFNAPETGGLTGNIAMLPGATRVDTLEMLKELERATIKVSEDFKKEQENEPVTFMLTQVGGNSGRPLTGSENKDPDLLGSITVELIDADLRDYSSFAFVGALQQEVNRLPMLETLSFRGWRAGPGGNGLEISIVGGDAQILKKSSEWLIAQLNSFAEISGLEDNQAYDKNELVLELTQRGKSLGFTIDSIGKELYSRLNGIEAVSFPFQGKSAKIMVSLASDNIKADFLTNTYLRSSAGKYVKLSDIVTVGSELGFSTISRENGQRKIIVSGDISEDNPAIAAFISEEVETVILPELVTKFGVEAELSGLAAQERDFLNDALVGFILCLFGIYLALAWVFESWTRPIVIMVIIPFGFIGAVWGHFWWGVPLSMFSIIGLIGMTGIIINDSIVLISTIDEYAKKRGMIPSIIDATSDRLRPVLLTTLTTVLGLLPLLFETSKDAQFLKPTVITLVYGLGFGLLIVLILVPAFAAVQLDFKRSFQSFRRIISIRKLSLFGVLSFWVSFLSIICAYLVSLGSLLIYDTPAKFLTVLFPNMGSILVSNVFFIGIALCVFLYFYLLRKKIFKVNFKKSGSIL